MPLPKAATFWTQLNRVWVETEPGSMGLNPLIRRLGEEAPAFLSIAAERIVDRLDAVGDTELGIIQAKSPCDRIAGFHRYVGQSTKVGMRRQLLLAFWTLSARTRTCFDLGASAEDRSHVSIRRLESSWRAGWLIESRSRTKGELPFGSATDTSRELPFDGRC